MGGRTERSFFPVLSGSDRALMAPHHQESELDLCACHYELAWVGRRVTLAGGT